MMQRSTTRFGFQIRTLATAKAVKFERFGNPENVIKVTTEEIPDNPGANQVLVKMLAVPISTSDLFTIKGFGPSGPGVVGHEGVGIVTKVGSGVSNVSVNDWVVPARSGLGTWRTELVVDSEAILPISKDIPSEFGATIYTPSIAYRLLNDFVDLKEGDVIVQNGGNSAIGQAVVQLAAKRGIKTINIIRDRPYAGEAIHHLSTLGSFVTLIETLFQDKSAYKVVSDLPKPKLALNCVGGSQATEVARLLGQNGVMVTYGTGYRKPISIPVSLFVERNISLRGFSMTRWLDRSTREEKIGMFEQVASLMKGDQPLETFIEKFPFSEFDAAMEKRQTPFQNRKIVLDMQK